MLVKQRIKQLTDYWINSSKEKYKTMQGLYRIKRYADCLFFGHLILEKSLKALVVQKIKDQAPRTHNLPYLMELADIALTEKDKSLIARADTFNLTSRYPDEKLAFYKKCTKQYTDQYYQPIIILYKKLCQLAR